MRRTFTAETQEPQRVYPKKETPVLELSGVSTQPHRQCLDFTGTVTVKLDDAAKGAIVRLRQGSPSGPIVGADEPTMFTPDKDGTVTVDFDEATDNIGEFAGRSYFLTVQQVDAEGDASVQTARLEAKQR